MLASHLKMTFKELLERMDSRELSEWMAYYNLEPFGEERADIRQGITSCVMANSFSNKKHKIDDFIPKFRQQRKEPKDWETMKAMLQGFTELYNKGKIK